MLVKSGACETPDELKEEEVQKGSQSQVRRSTRLKCPNTKYIDATLTKMVNIKEATNFEAS